MLFPDLLGFNGGLGDVFRGEDFGEQVFVFGFDEFFQERVEDVPEGFAAFGMGKDNRSCDDFSPCVAFR